MTEQEWMASNDPTRMLACLLQGGEGRSGPGAPIYVKRLPCCTDRKLRLWAVACCRQPEVWDGVECKDCNGRGNVRDDWFVGDEGRLTCGRCRGTGKVGGLQDPRSRRAVEVAERHADGDATVDEMNRAWRESMLPDEPQWSSIPNYTRHPALVVAGHVAIARGVDWVASVPERLMEAGVLYATQAALLRCVVGNPFRPPTLKRLQPPTVTRLAQIIYDQRDWTVLPLLWDALEESGCADEHVRLHCLEPLHARGCHAIDALLGKE